MATTHYVLESRITDTKAKVTFDNGYFKKLELVKGNDMAELKGIFEQIYYKESAYVLNLEEGIFNAEAVYKVFKQTSTAKPKSKYQQYVTAWYDFYTKFVGVKPKFTKADGQNLKQIIKYLNEISTDENQALTVWQTILLNWKNLDSFHQRNTDIKYINSQLNKIISNVKAVNTKQSGVSDSYKQRVMDELRTS